VETYKYKFVVEGKESISDPRNMYQIGKYHNSMLRRAKERALAVARWPGSRLGPYGDW